MFNEGEGLIFAQWRYLITLRNKRRLLIVMAYYYINFGN